jgi:hypothetical protein
VPSSTLTEVRWQDYDFIDLGSSKGGSIAFCTKRFGASRGLGVDLDPNKVEETRRSGADAVLADAAQLDVSKKVRFVSMLDFLEHLPSLEIAEAVIAQAAEAATDFLFIRHPSFEGEGLIELLGVRQYWWHWSGHTCHLRVSDYCSIFERLGLGQFSIRYKERVDSTDHPSLLPLSAPINSHAYDPELHDPKPSQVLPWPIWRSQVIFIALRPFTPEEWLELLAKG